VKDFHNKNYKPCRTVLKMIPDLPSSWIARIPILKTAILPKAIYRFNARIIKIPMSFFIKIFLNPKIHMEE
jgi:hypothetical protein